MSVFKDLCLLSNVRARAPVNIYGISGASIQVTQEGETPVFGTVLYHPGAAANVVSMSNASKTGSISYDQATETFTLNAQGRVAVFRCVNGLYRLDPHTESAFTIETVATREAAIPKRTLGRLKGVVKLVETLGYPSDRDVISMIESGKILNCPYTARELIQAREVYGPSLGALKGKTKRVKPAAVPIYPVPIPLQPDQVLHCDIMFVESKMFVIAVSKPLGLTSVCEIEGKGCSPLFQAMRKHFGAYAAQRFRVTTLVWGREPGIMGLNERINREGIKVEGAGSGQHVPVVEAKIRVVKERARAVINTLPYVLPKRLVGALISYVVSRMNWMPNVNSGPASSPKSIYLARLMDLKIDARIGFGEYAQVKTLHELSNSMEPRTEGAIALNPAENLSGSVRFFVLRTKATVVRDQWTTMPMPAEAIETLNAIAAGKKRDDEPAPPATLPATERISPEPEPMAPRQEDVPATLTTNDRDVDTDPDDQIREEVFHISVKEGMATRGAAAEVAIKRELGQMLSKKVWRPIASSEFLPVRPIPSSMFLKEKFHPDGSFDKLKARLVAGGHRQDRSVYDDVSFPTVSRQCVMMVAAIAAAENRKVGVCDIGSAYLNASIGDNVVFMRLDETITRILCELDESHKEAVRPDGTSVVQLIKALYGCIESSKLWGEELTSALTSDGFTRNDQDPCVMNKTHDGNQVTVCFHVDDLLITCVSEVAIDDVVAKLRSRYGEVSYERSDKVSYLGIGLQFNVAGEVSLSMDGYVRDVLSAAGDGPKFATPALSLLFEVRESELLPPPKKEEFHSMFAKLLYLSKHVRPDLLLAVSFLATRVTSPTLDDQTKLDRLLGFLRGNPARALQLKADLPIRAVAYVDARRKEPHGVRNFARERNCVREIDEAKDGLQVVQRGRAAGPIRQCFASAVDQNVPTRSRIRTDPPR
jgi:hypothetical protein